MVDKLLPHDVDSEEALLGSLLLDNDALHKVYSIIQPPDFYSERDRWIYEACVALFDRREAINQITVAQDLARQDKLENCGGAAFLSHLISVCPTSLDVEYYAQIVYRLSVSRKVIAASDQIASIGYQSLPDPNETLAKSTEIITTLQKKCQVVGNDIITPHQAAQTAMDLIAEYNEPDASLSYGYRDLDEITTGIHDELVIFGSRPSVGKTQLLLDVAHNQEARQKKSLFVTSEMSLKRIIERQFASATGVSVRELRKNGIKEDLEGNVMRTIGEMSEGYISYMTGKIYAKSIYAAVQKMKESGGVDIVFVDYLQFLADCWEDTRENQNIRVGKACKILKNIVEELGTPVILASQLNRSVEYRSKESKTPTLADLRDSGNIEQDADVVLLLYRNEIDDYTLDSTLQIKMAKHRQLGVAPHVQLSWDKERSRYVDCVEG
jgi:replicative DNA helicase